MLRIKCDQGPGVVAGTKQLLNKCQFSPCINRRQLPSCQAYKMLRLHLETRPFFFLFLDLHIPCDKSQKQPSRHSTRYSGYAHITPVSVTSPEL